MQRGKNKTNKTNFCFIASSFIVGIRTTAKNCNKTNFRLSDSRQEWLMLMSYQRCIGVQGK